MARTRKFSLLSGILTMKCPACRSHDVFRFRNPFLLKKVGLMYEYCPSCGNSNRVEPGFYFGAAYVSYMLMVGLLLGLVLAYYLVFGEIFEHFWRLMTFAVVLSIISTPVVFRYSRIIFLYICVPFKGAPEKEKTEDD
ncbi:MAG: hypothetical protein RL213_1156 [Bacteroidota bacterium]|jgi:hypothetical protein